MEKIKLGDEVKCRVTGFQGIVVSTSQWITGCDRVGVRAPMTKEGKLGEAYDFDEPVLELIKKKKVKMVQSEDTIKKGGPITSPMSRA